MASNNKIHILFILERYPGFGGIETVTKILSTSFIKNLEYKVTIFSTSQQDNENQIIKDSSFQLIIADGDEKNRKTIFRNYVRQNNPDIAIYQDSYVDNTYLLECLPTTTQLIVCEHNTPDCLLKGLVYITKNLPLSNPINIYRKLRLPFKKWELHHSVALHHQKLYNLCERYILLSESFRDILDKVCDVRGDKIKVIPNPVDIKPKKHPKDNVALFVARLTHQKGIRYLLDIWDLLCKRSKLKLIIVGDGDQRLWIEKEITARHLKNIELVGFREDVSGYYDIASIHLMTSIYEGFGITNIEAMSRGVIPFSFDSYSSVYDIIDNERNGFIIPSFDIKAYSHKILEFLSLKEELKDQMRDSAIEKAKRFSVSNITKEWELLFNDLIHLK